MAAASPAVAVTPVGIAGTTIGATGVTAPDGVDSAMPVALTAVTVNV
jgi:hypothetical protein